MLNLNDLKITTSLINDDVWLSRNITLSMLRLDEIDPVISGNKMFKLYYFLKKASNLNLKIITFGGSYSNHLAATACACKQYNLRCIGVVRGEKPLMLSPTLSYCLQQNMHLEFISRNAYNQKDVQSFTEELHTKFADHILIPEGGFGSEGVRGASEISKFIDSSYTHICCSVGTATTLAGLMQSALPHQQVIGFSALKEIDSEERLSFLLNKTLPPNYCIIKRYHFGGYAKKSNELIRFMNTFYEKCFIPLDFVYTAKMMFGITDMLNQNFFEENSRILCLHTGGLQGNASLMPGLLKY